MAPEKSPEPPKRDWQKELNEAMKGLRWFDSAEKPEDFNQVHEVYNKKTRLSEIWVSGAEGDIIPYKDRPYVCDGKGTWKPIGGAGEGTTLPR